MPRSSPSPEQPKRDRGATNALALAVGARIRERRLQLGLSGTALATAVGVPSTALVAWEKGRVVPSVGSLLTLAEALGCSPATLLPPTDEPRELFERIARLPKKAIAEVAALVSTLEEHGRK